MCVCVCTLVLFTHELFSPPQMHPKTSCPLYCLFLNPPPPFAPTATMTLLCPTATMAHTHTHTHTHTQTNTYAHTCIHSLTHTRTHTLTHTHTHTHTHTQAHASTSRRDTKQPILQNCNANLRAAYFKPVLFIATLLNLPPPLTPHQQWHTNTSSCKHLTQRHNGPFCKSGSGLSSS